MMSSVEKNTKKRIWFGRAAKLIFYFVLINIMIFAIGYWLHFHADQQSLRRSLDSLNSSFAIFAVVRCSVEAWVVLNWRRFVGICKRLFRLSFHKTAFLLECRRIFLMFALFDIATSVIAYGGQK